MTDALITQLRMVLEDQNEELRDISRKEEELEKRRLELDAERYEVTDGIVRTQEALDDLEGKRK